MINKIVDRINKIDAIAEKANKQKSEIRLWIPDHKGKRVFGGA